MELIIDPSFELDTSGLGVGEWSRNARADRTQPGGAHHGTWVQECEFEQLPGASIGRFGQKIAVPDAEKDLGHKLSFWGRLTNSVTPGTSRQEIDIWPGHFNPAGGGNFGGTPIEILYIDLVTMSTSWTEFTIPVVIPGRIDVTLGIREDRNGAAIPFESRMEYDLFSFAVIPAELDKMITGLLRDAIVADLESITAANGYPVTVNKVYPEPLAVQDRVFPFLELTPTEGGFGEGIELGSRGGASEQTFRVRGGVASGAPLDDVLVLLDSVRNSIEVITAAVNVLQSPKVISAVVTNWENTLTEDDIANGLREFTADIVCTYSYTRGSA